MDQVDNPSDTTGAYGANPGGGDKGDDELLADISAVPILVNALDLWNQDWGELGVRKGQPYFRDNAHPYAPLRAYFTFIPKENGQQPFNVYTMGDLTNYVSRVYGPDARVIQSLDDL